MGIATSNRSSAVQRASPSSFASMSLSASSHDWCNELITSHGLGGRPTFKHDGTVIQTGLFGTVKRYKAGDVVHGGFLGYSKKIPGAPSPYVTPNSSPVDATTPGDSSIPGMTLK